MLPVGNIRKFDLGFALGSREDSLASTVFLDPIIAVHRSRPVHIYSDCRKFAFVRSTCFYLLVFPLVRSILVHLSVEFTINRCQEFHSY